METTTWKDWRDGTVWKVALTGALAAARAPEEDGCGVDRVDPSDGPASLVDRIVFRGLVGGLPVDLAASCPSDTSLDGLTEYELQWYLDEALAGYLDGS